MERTPFNVLRNRVPGKRNGMTFVWYLVFIVCFIFFFVLQGNSMSDELVMVSQESGTAGDNNSQATDVIAKGEIVVIQSLASNLAGEASGTSMQIMQYNFSTDQWTLISSTATGTEGDGQSGHPDITADNRYVVFHSASTNLGGTGVRQQIFRKDLTTGEIILVSKTSAGVEADNTCRRPVISEDGSKVVFDSSATDLPPEKLPKSKLTIYNYTVYMLYSIKICSH